MVRRKTTDAPKATTKKPTTKRKQPTRIKSNPTPQHQNEQAVLPTNSFHETFPVTLEFKEDKDVKRCYFVCKEHCDSYLNRYKLKKGTYKVYDTKPKDEKK